jgi:hypothetical protein
VEGQHFAGAGAGIGAQVSWPGSISGSGYVNSDKNVTKNPKFFILKFEFEIKTYFFVAIYLQYLL